MLRNKVKRGLALSAMVALGLAAAMPARAAIVNGGFEGFPDFTGYSTLGNTSVQGSSYKTPTEGTQQALLSNNTNAVPGSTGATTNIGSLDAFVNLGSGVLEGQGAKSGTAIKQTFTANAGDKISFSTDFVTNDRTNPDFAFFTLQSGSTTTEIVLATAGVTPTVPTNALVEDVGSDFNRETGYTTTTLTLVAGGTYTLAFGVVNFGDTNVTSGLLVDNIALAAGPGGGGVPLPAGAYLMTLGLATAGMFSAKLRRTMA